MFQHSLRAAPELKLSFNIGALFDIPSGYWLKGKYGENLLTGGLGMITAIVGPANTYKSTLLHYTMLSAISRIIVAYDTKAMTYDSEMNVHYERLRNFAMQFESIKARSEKKGADILRDGTWVVTDETVYMAEQFFTEFKKFAEAKIKLGKAAYVKSPFIDTSTNDFFESILTTFSQFDSWSEMVSSETQDIFDKNKIGEDSSSAMVYMRQGLAKAGFLTQIPHLAGAASHYVLLTAHVGDNKPVQSGPIMLPPKKPLPHIPFDKTIKGVGSKFFYLLHNCWWIHDAKRLLMDDKTVRYPKRQGEAYKDDFDLNILRIQNIRSKNSADGYTLNIILSMESGIQPSLTEYHHLKNFANFGMVGNANIVELGLLPGVKLSRTTIRQKIDEEPLLARALNITSEIAQMYQHQRYLSERLCDPNIMREKLTEAGYDVDWLLANTRGWWTYNNEKVDKYYLSSLDLCDMVNGKYHPYWLEDDKKTVKKEYFRKTDGNSK